MIAERLIVSERISPGRTYGNTQRIRVVTVVEESRSKHWKTVLTVCRLTIACAMTVCSSECFLDKLTAKAQKITIKLPWEIQTIYSEVLKNSGHQSDDEEDEDDIEAHEASIQRLKVRMATTNVQNIF